VSKAPKLALYVNQPQTTAAIKAATNNYKTRDDIGCNHQRYRCNKQVNKKCGMGFFALDQDVSERIARAKIPDAVSLKQHLNKSNFLH